MAEILWNPNREQIRRSNLEAFIREVRRTQESEGDAERVTTFDGLYRWSIAHPDRFWVAVWEFCGVRRSVEPERVVDGFDRMPGTRWFPGSRLNFAENLLRYGDSHPAIVSWNENGRQKVLSYEELHDRVARLAGALRDAGVKEGDRVAGFLPNIPEAIIAMLAATSLGALWSSCSPDFGLQGVLDRFGQIEPKILFCADGYFYGGKRFDSLERVAAAVRQVPTIEHVLVVPYTESEPALGKVPNATLLDQFIGSGSPPALKFEQLPFDHPVYIMYSSGTTGPPKCIVHGAGGTLIQHLKELVLHTDLRREDRIFYFSTCGWMMWNWMVSSLAVGATAVLFDGSPFHPGPNCLFDMAEQEDLTVFGTSARYLVAAEKAGIEPGRTHELPTLRSILSTGSPLPDESFDYVYSKIKKDVCLSSISGGTDIISCFALGNPVGPVRRGELQTRGLGMRVEVYSDDGSSLPPGEKGELVCSAPFPSMPIGFWNDPDEKKYRAAYFRRFPGVWHHGDYCELTSNGGMIIWGRSDAVLNPGGVRIGTAEIYRIVEKFPEVLEAVAVGQKWNNDVRVVLFVRLGPEVRIDGDLQERLRRQIRQEISPRYVPAKIIAVDDIPRTLNGKVAELAVRHVIHDRPVKNSDALANPEALDLYRNLEELKV